MAIELTWYFEISADANMAIDEFGNPAACYSTYSMSFSSPPADKDAVTEAVIEHLAAMGHIDKELITPITKEQYEREMSEEDE